MVFTTLQEIEQHTFWGCHAYDSEAFQAITEFVKRAEVPEAAKALQVMLVRGMGFPEDPRSDEEIVAEFLAEQL